jgi:hypothetical protein
MSRYFSSLDVYIEHLLLTPANMPRKDFKLFQYSWSYSYSQLTPLTKCLHRRGANLRLFYKNKLSGAKYSRSQDSPVSSHRESRFRLQEVISTKFHEHAITVERIIIHKIDTELFLPEVEVE